jgi:hypothetical protein
VQRTSKSLTCSKNVKQSSDETRAYFVDAAGDPTDGGFVQALIDSGQANMDDFADLNPESLKKLKLNGPGSVIELMDRVKILPDVREVRRISGNRMMKRALTRKSGDQRAAVAYSEYMQNKIWKPITLATGGYMMRNMVDAQNSYRHHRKKKDSSTIRSVTSNG